MDINLTCLRRSFRNLILFCPLASENESDVKNVYGVLFTNWAAILFIVIVGIVYKIIKFEKNPNVETIKDEKIKQTFNLIFLGETGVGKSTLINSFINYLKFPKFNSAKNCEMEYCIPYQFCVQKHNRPFENIWISSFENDNIHNNNVNHGNENFNIRGESVTQMPQEHILTFNNYNLQIIDTPGIKDTRGPAQDQQNLNYIKNFINIINKIDAICFIVHSNQTKLEKEFEYSMRNLLSLFPEPYDNVYFFFTYATLTSFHPGDTMTVIQQFCEKYNFTIPLKPDNIFLVDNEAYRYLLAKEQNVNFSSKSEDEMLKMWEKSSAEIYRFFDILKI